MTKPYNNREALLTALACVITAAPDRERNQLSQALEDYAYAYPRSYRDLTHGKSLIASLLDCLEENADCRIHRNSVGLPEQGSLD